MPIEVGKIVEGRVINITDFGAFIELPEGKTGLVHISEVSDTYVKNIREYLKENDKVSVLVLSIEKGGKISLSIKKANKKTSRPIEVDWSGNKMRTSGNMSFEDRLAKFLKDSDERQKHLKKQQVSKRRNNGYNRKSYE